MSGFFLPPSVGPRLEENEMTSSARSGDDSGDGRTVALKIIRGGPGIIVGGIAAGPVVIDMIIHGKTVECGMTGVEAAVENARIEGAHAARVTAAPKCRGLDSGDAHIEHPFHLDVEIQQADFGSQSEGFDHADRYFHGEHGESERPGGHHATETFDPCGQALAFVPDGFIDSRSNRPTYCSGNFIVPGIDLQALDLVGPGERIGKEGYLLLPVPCDGHRGIVHRLLVQEDCNSYTVFWISLGKQCFKRRADSPRGKRFDIVQEFLAGKMLAPFQDIDSFDLPPIEVLHHFNRSACGVLYNMTLKNSGGIDFISRIREVSARVPERYGCRKNEEKDVKKGNYFFASS